MEKIINFVNQAWFKAALAGAVGTALLVKGEVFYAGIAYGYGVREFFLAFKK